MASRVKTKSSKEKKNRSDEMPKRNKKNFRPTEKGAGMTEDGVKAYKRKNPGSKLKTAVTGKVKKGSKDAKRRKSYCARSAGQRFVPKEKLGHNARLILIQVLMQTWRLLSIARTLTTPRVLKVRRKRQHNG